MYTVYVLIDPRDDAICYVGITEDVYARFSQHLQCNGSNIGKNEWIRELKSVNVMLIMRTVEVVETVEKARDREQYWIQQYLSQGFRLLNVSITKVFTYDDFMGFFEGVQRGINSLTVKSSKRFPLPSSQTGSAASVTFKEAANILGFTEAYIRELRNNGKLRSPSRDKKKVTKKSIEMYRQKYQKKLQ